MARESGVQVLTPADLDQPPQGTPPVAQPHHVDRLAGVEPEPLPGQPLRVVLVDLVPEQLPQVAYQLGAFP